PAPTPRQCGLRRCDDGARERGNTRREMPRMADGSKTEPEFHPGDVLSALAQLRASGMAEDSLAQLLHGLAEAAERPEAQWPLDLRVFSAPFAFALGGFTHDVMRMSEERASEQHAKAMHAYRMLAD